MNRRPYLLINDGTRSGYSEEMQTPANVIAELESALELLATVDQFVTVLPVDDALTVAAVRDRLTHLDRWLPRVEGWCCGYFWGRPDEHGERRWSTFSAHLTQEHALTWLPGWRREQPSEPDHWEVRLMPTRILEFVKLGTTFRQDERR